MMVTVLRVDCSPMLGLSHSRALGDVFEAALAKCCPAASVKRRDLVLDPLPLIDADANAAFFSPPESLSERGREAIRRSDALVDELLAADLLLLTTPLHNFTVPANLKTWIDLIVGHGRTFRYEQGQSQGLLGGKRALVLVAYGLCGYVGVVPRPASDHLQPYLRYVLAFIGIDEVEFIGVDGTVFEAQSLSVRRGAAEARIRAYVSAWAGKGLFS